ncbi:MAG: LamG domain-containing protein [Planctomycetes bacterium]|nr:LamG domain-containing protein [Planctomycetota bacterium]
MKHVPVLGLLTLAAVPLLTIVSPAGLEEPGCVAHWRFTNGVKGVASGQDQVMFDVSGHDQNGLAVGGPVFQRVESDRFGLGLQFTDDRQRVFVPDDAAFALTDSLTLEAWVRVDSYIASPSRLGYIVFRGDDRPGFDPWFLGVRDSGQLVFLIADELNHNAAVVSPEPLPLGRLIHVAGTFDGSSGQLQLFVDGERVASSDTSLRPAGVLGGPGAGIGIGNVQSGGDQGFRGLIGEVRVCGAALPPERFLIGRRAVR